jgi:hypothetical protein
MTTVVRHTNRRDGHGLAAMLHRLTRAPERLRAAVDARKATRLARIVEVQTLGPSLKLAVVEFGDKTLLLSIARDGARLVAEA